VGTRFDVGYGQGDREDSCKTVDRSNGVGGTVEGDLSTSSAGVVRKRPDWGWAPLVIETGSQL